MNLKNKLGLVFFLFLISFPSIFAVQTQIINNFIEQESSTGLQILYPNNPYHKLGDDLDFYFHVFNSTNHLIPTDEVFCDFHLYEPVKNEHVLETVPIVYGVEFEIELNDSILTKKGMYEFNLWCNSTQGEAGFVSGGFIVNDAGQETKDTSFLAIIALIPLILAIILMLGASSMSEEHSVLKIFLFLLSYSSLFISLWFAMIITVQLYNLFELQEAIGTFTLIMGSMYFVLITYFVFYAIQQTKLFFEKKKEDKQALEY